MKFQPNDPVRVIATPSRHFDAVGTVADHAAGQFRVDMPGGPLWFWPHELILAEPPVVAS